MQNLVANIILYVKLTRKINSLEEWRPVPGHEGLYEVSSLGRVKSFVTSNPKIIMVLKTKTAI